MTGNQQNWQERFWTLARDLKEFLSRWSSEPIIYTGGGTTDEVICMLDALITKAENGSSPDLLRRLSKV
ncbi:MAG: hypothetical protein ACOX5M_00360 [Bacillota bacterium]